MARDQALIDLSKDAYTEITDGVAVDVITFQALHGDVFIKYTQDETPPSVGDRGYRYLDGQGEAARDPRDFTNWDAPSRVWAIAVDGSGSRVNTARVIVDHA